MSILGTVEWPLAFRGRRRRGVKRRLNRRGSAGGMQRQRRELVAKARRKRGVRDLDFVPIHRPKHRRRLVLLDFLKFRQIEFHDAFPRLAITWRTKSAAAAAGSGACMTSRGMTTSPSLSMAGTLSLAYEFPGRVAC